MQIIKSSTSIHSECSVDKSKTINLSGGGIVYTLLKWCLLFLFLTSLNAWFTWNVKIIFVDIICIVAFMAFLLKKKAAFSFTFNNKMLSFLFLIVKGYDALGQNINGFFGSMLLSVVVFFMICLKDEYKIDILNFLTKSLAVLLSISLVGWVLFLLGVPLQYHDVNYGNGQYYFRNYYFFIFSSNYIDLIHLPRFSSVFLEPGHLAMVAAPLLFVYKFNLRKKEILVLLIALLAGFSLAAYIVGVVSLLGVSMLNSKRPFVYTIIILSLLFSAYSFFTNYRDGGNVVNRLIIERLGLVDGKLAGDNRFTAYLDNYFNQFVKTDDLFFGIGNVEFAKIDWDGGNAGYKRYLIVNGVTGAILTLIFYSCYSLKYKSKSTLIFLFLYFLLFLQASYPYWECVLILYVSALPILAFSVKYKRRVGWRSIPVRRTA